MTVLKIAPISNNFVTFRLTTARTVGEEVGTGCIFPMYHITHGKNGMERKKRNHASLYWDHYGVDTTF